MSKERSIKVRLFEGAERKEASHFADLELPDLPRKDDTIEIGFPNQQIVKSFTVWRVIWKMVQLPRYETRYVEGFAVQCQNDPPWHWEIHLHGYLYDPSKEVPQTH
jgi:hypothetical protein